jgi:alkylation response protein AidB-like acyl-CoA dehydrogenase
MQHNNLAMSFSEEQGMLLDSAREFCRNRSDISAVRALLDSDRGYDEQVWQELVELGWMGIAIDEAHGGSGLAIGSAVPVAECMGRYLLSTPFITATLVAQALQRGGSTQQCETHLPAICAGEVATLALLESEDWGDGNVSLAAEAHGDKLRLIGSKTQVAYAGEASLFLLSVMTTGERGLLLVPAEAVAATAISSQVNIDQTRRSSRIDFTGVEVPRENLLPGDAATIIRDLMLLGGLLYGAEATGSTAACMDVTVGYLNTRKQFGRLIGSYQALKHPMVEVLCGMDAARSFIYHAATVVGEGPLDVDAEIACRMAKAQASDALKFAGDRAVQFHGGMGFTYECDAQLYIRRAQWSQQVFGDAYHHRKRLAPLLFDHP